MYRLTFDAKDKVPAELAEFAKEITEDGENKGKWVVKVVPDQKLVEFRDNNIKVVKERDDALKARDAVLAVVGLKPEELAEKLPGVTDELKGLRQTQQLVNDGKLKGDDKIAAEIESRTRAMKEKHEETLAEKQREIAAALARANDFEAKYKRTFIDRAVMDALGDEKLGVAPTASSDIVRDAYDVFKVQEDGSLKAFKGDQQIYGEDAVNPLSVREWIDRQVRKSKPHYFKRSNGGGAEGGNGETNYGGMSQEAFDKLSPLAKLKIANEQEAKKAAATRR